MATIDQIIVAKADPMSTNTPFPTTDWGNGLSTTSRPLRLTRAHYVRHHEVTGLEHSAHIIVDDQALPCVSVYINDKKVATTETLSEAVGFLRTATPQTF